MPQSGGRRRSRTRWTAAVRACQPHGSKHEARAFCGRGHLSVADEYATSQSVVIGHVVSERLLPETATADVDAGTEYVVEVDETFRGQARDTIRLYSENSSGRFPMTIGETYVLFVSVAEGERLSIDDCGHSGLVKEAAAVVDDVRRLSRPDRGGSAPGHVGAARRTTSR